MPNPTDRPLVEGSGGPSSEPHPAAKRVPLLEYGVVTLVAALALAYAIAAYEHESVGFRTVSSTATALH